VDETQEALERLAAVVGEQLKSRHWWLVTAESCTGGWIAQAVTSVAGSSEWFDRGFVTYSNLAKQEVLGVPEPVLRSEGAVSEAAVRHMVQGALRFSHAQVAVAVSGIAGPGGGVPGKPVGTVFLAWGLGDAPPEAERHHFHGDRAAVRRQTVARALEGILDRLGRSPGGGRG